MPIGAGEVSLTLFNNPTLETLQGLEGLESIAGKVQIMLNTNLSSVDALSGVQEIGGDLSISSNPVLCEADVLAMVADITVLGAVAISDNGPCPPAQLAGCEDTGPTAHVTSVTLTPTSPDSCTETSVTVNGVHAGLNYGFGTTNVGKCWPPDFNCGEIPAVLTLNLSASADSTNPLGPGYSDTFDFGVLPAHTYCLKVRYNSPQSEPEEFLTQVTVTPCN